MSGRQRWPARVYGEGEEPDYRFSLANERTFLAWLRTGLALIAAGIAVDVVDLSLSVEMTAALATLLLLLGAGSAVLAFLRWAGSERAMRLGAPLPAFGVTATLFAGALTVLALLAIVIIGVQ
ncbi:YidH family protein [Marihabitans asiaticum]|uniref:Putative membrane protein n=1 Tax=Marihabitans asiaticum TaxID=415218 RepID=A0A560WIB3_9MICO|nr:DUF202 domain-containing protein [Marihabitans asiaticum]TWD17280.1 putative membrane protein [Marihabitans asiaticum]